MLRPTRPNGAWTYADATKAVPYVRRLLRGLRRHYVACWHYWTLVGNDASSPFYRAERRFHRRRGEAALRELERLGVFPYEAPLRGVGLFTFTVEVQLDELATVEKVAHWVYRDSRVSIDTFAFAEDLNASDDLPGSEHPVPESLKAGGNFLWLADLRR